MQGKRMDRVGHLIQMELGETLVYKMKDPGLGFVTITHVSVTPDLRSARVFYSVIGDGAARQSTQKAFERAAGFLQRAIGSSLVLRYTPKLTFAFDETLDKTTEIDRVLKNIDDDRKKNSEPSLEE